MTTTRPVGTGEWVGVPTAWRQPWQVLGLEVCPLPAGTPLERQVAPLVENLARASGSGCAAFWLPDDEQAAGWIPLVVRCAGQDGADSAEPCAGPVRSVDDLRAVPGVEHLARLTDGDDTIGVITIGRPSHRHSPADAGPADAGCPDDLGCGVPEQVLAQTRDCLTLLMREFLLGLALRGQQARADRLDARLVWIQAELDRVCDAERRRLAGRVLAGPTRALADVTRYWRACAAVVRDLGVRDGLGVRDDPRDLLGSLRELRSALDVLVDDFRTVARAVHPSTLRGRGTVAALGELAARLPRGARLCGDLGRRVGWEVESGIYHAAAAVLTAMNSTPGPELVARFARAGGRLVVRVDDPVPRPPGEVWADLAEDARRLVALGGGLRYELGADGTGSVELWLPEQLLAVGEAPVQ